jgi:hypothetical protein
MNKFQAHQTVKVADKEYERFGQVGTVVGEKEGEVEIKFEAAAGGEAPQEFDSFPVEAIEVV